MIAAYLSTEEIKKYSDCVVLLPFGSFEQHGPWMPLATDAIIAEEIAKKVEKRIPEKVILFPTIWFGDSQEHKGFPGTLSLSAFTTMKMLEELFTWFEESNFRRGILYNGHGGNVNIANAICEEYSRAHSYKIKHLYTGNKEVKSLAQALFGQAETHAGSTEMSVFYALRSDLTTAKKAPLPVQKPYEGGKFALYETRYISPNGILTSSETIDFDIKKGEKIVEKMVETLIVEVEKIQSV